MFLKQKSKLDCGKSFRIQFKLCSSREYKVRFRSTEENSKAEVHEVRADDQSEVSAVLTVRKQIKSQTRNIDFSCVFRICPLMFFIKLIFMRLFVT